jgi:hypothetical protein
MGMSQSRASESEMSSCVGGLRVARVASASGSQGRLSLGAVQSAAAGRTPNSFSSACRGHVPELLFPFRKCSRPDGPDNRPSRSSSTCELSTIANANLARSNNSTQPTISDHSIPNPSSRPFIRVHSGSLTVPLLYHEWIWTDPFAN